MRNTATKLAGAAIAVALVALALAPTVNAASANAKRLQQLIEGPQRSAANKARDAFRKPLATLKFLKVTPRAKVVDVLPGSAGYWTEILAPYLKKSGQYVAAIPRPNPERPEVMKSIADTRARYAADPASYDKVVTIDFSADAPDLGAKGSDEHVLVFR
jgi:predicted methyltransferase